MGYSTTYDVKVRYSMESRAAQTGVRGLVADTRTLGTEVKRTSGMFGRLAATVAATFGARMAGKALVGFNATVEDTKNQIAGMLALTKKTDLQDQLGNADRLFANLQKRAKALPGTTQEYTRMAGMLAQPISDAGGTLKNLEDLTVNSTVAAKALGYQWDLAARDIDQALRGQFHATDPFAGKVLGSIGYKGEEGRSKFNSLSADKRFDEIQRALMQPQFTQLAAAQGASFSGVLSTLQDTLEQFLGKVGLPLFKAITTEIKNWNKWIDANSAKVDGIAKSIGEGLVDGFRFVKDALGFLVEHADTLILIGKVWAGVKLGGMLSGALGKGGGGVSGALGGMFGAGGFFRGASDRFNPETGEYEYTKAGAGRSAVGGIKGAMGNIGMLGQSLGAGFAIGTVLNEWTGASSAIADGLAHMTGRVDETTDKFYKIQKSMDALDAATRRVAEANAGAPKALTNVQGASLDAAQRANLIRDFLAARDAANAAGPTDFGAQGRYYDAKAALESAGLSESLGGVMRAQMSKALEESNVFGARATASSMLTSGAFFVGVRTLTDYQRKTLDSEKAQEQLSAYMVQQLDKGEAFNPATVLDILRHNTNDPEGKHKIADKPKVNVTIQRIEVQSDDPDRMAFGLIEAFRDAAKNPSSAIAAIREG